MRTFTLSIKNTWQLSLLFILSSLALNAQEIPFNCDYSAYLFQYNDVYAIDLASGNSYVVAEDVTPGNINATAYNPADGYIWGSLSTPSKTIVRIGKNFTTTTYYIPELPDSGRYVGDINSEGVYYLKGGGSTYYKINLDPASSDYSKFIATGKLSKNISIHDWAFNAVDGNIYAVEKNTNILYRINPENGDVLALGEVPILSGLSYTYGAVYFDASGRFYVSANQTGTIYVIQSVQDINDTASISSNLFAFGPSSASNDGARCPTAPVAQEICDNGIDDDGDGLIDCEDPSCSGFGDCAVIELPTSGGNAGGLESNNRLSTLINKRNFNRAKNSYQFNTATAPRVYKTQNYSLRDGETEFELKDFIPLEIIAEDEAIESTPADLATITNATEVYAVDYLKNDASVASILALKTENGVYEHTKYICDRLLGAELISVSTIDINEQPFIKSIIKNADGTFEYVLSFSAKLINKDNNFSIESHWNLDRYEQEVTFYNFQIWTNSLDDLFLLGEEVLNLINVVNPISEYNNTKAPTVFVRKGKYTNGALDLQIINTNATENVILDAGFRTSETSDFEYSESNIDLNKNYITNIQVPTGNLFDIGFRIGDGENMPDDLFMSDGPWGIDDSSPETIVESYEVHINENNFESDEFPIERNVSLSATTSDYIAVYRALTPRFKAVNLSDFNSLKFNAKGTGELQITFVKQSITEWESQFTATILLDEELQSYELPFSKFTSTTDLDMILNDVVTIVFTMVSKDGSMTTKKLALTDVRFSKELIIESVDHNGIATLQAFPNPATSRTSIHFNADQKEEMELVIYNQTGKIVFQDGITAVTGNNEIEFNKQNLTAGLYYCQLLSSRSHYAPLKLVFK
ncbi:DUF6923 family protein [Portibacter lacus]|uniref:Secretion system C-terminal sorting domain-containing protein n=1 Tax=Portibacter lacus TaxID=1099794 RepID=A0AA37SR11_9BACT|nr:T9SS type A sorting domain-containing protein [Portibacter lacus]GLR19088.1 hypothetical protein GCM10007940_37040 [Portibacter lacus]